MSVILPLYSMSFAPCEQARQACAGPFHHSREQQRNRLELRCRPQRFFRPRQPRFQILREQGDQPAGDIMDQVRPAELRQHSGQSIADVELDPRGLRIDRQQSITNDALRRRTASPVLAAASYRPGATLRIALDLGQTVKFSCDRANLDAHLAGNGARVDISGYRRSGKAGGDRGHVREEAPDVVERVMDHKALVERRLRREIGRNLLASSKRILSLPASWHAWNGANGGITRNGSVAMVGTRRPECRPTGPRGIHDAAGPSILHDASDRIDDADIAAAAT